MSERIETGLLRRMAAADVERVRAWRNDESVRHHMFSRTEISPGESREWFERMSREADRHLMIFESGREPLGFVNIGPTDAVQHARWGFYVAPGAPKGTGKQLGRAALRFAFGPAELRCLCGEVLADNAASIGFHRSLGFTQRGEPTQRTLADGRTVSILTFALYARDYLENAGT